MWNADRATETDTDDLDEHAATHAHNAKKFEPRAPKSRRPPIDVRIRTSAPEPGIWNADNSTETENDDVDESVANHWPEIALPQ